jgi:Winged helix-turn helix
MTAPIRLRLDQATRIAVSERYEHTRGAVERTNCQIVLLADEGRHATEIAWLVRRGPDQVRTVLHRFQAEGLAGLALRPGVRRRSSFSRSVRPGRRTFTCRHSPQRFRPVIADGH